MDEKSKSPECEGPDGLCDERASGAPGLGRRAFLARTATMAVSAPLLAGALSAEQARAQQQTPADPALPQPMQLNLNGRDYPLNLDIRTSLLDAIRDYAGLTGTKKGCDHGQCGACTVLMNGQRVLSCLTFAVDVQGQPITTIEGLARGGNMHPMQAAFVDKDAFQCGYCTPGQIMSAVGCVSEGHANSAEEIREYMSGNICRCAAYPNIVAAILDARQFMGV